MGRWMDGTTVRNVQSVRNSAPVEGNEASGIDSCERSERSERPAETHRDAEIERESQKHVSIGNPFRTFGIQTAPSCGKPCLDASEHCSERSDRTELDPNLIPIAHPTALAPLLKAAAARGTEALAHLWCALSRCQQIDLKPLFDECWALAECTDARLRGEPEH
jgi:hypothetical protein